MIFARNLHHFWQWILHDFQWFLGDFFADSHGVLLVRGWNFAYFSIVFSSVFLLFFAALKDVFWHWGRILLPTGRFRNDLGPSLFFCKNVVLRSSGAFFRNPRKKTCRMVVADPFFVWFFIFSKIICFHECKEFRRASAYLLLRGDGKSHMFLHIYVFYGVRNQMFLYIPGFDHEQSQMFLYIPWLHDAQSQLFFYTPGNRDARSIMFLHTPGRHDARSQMFLHIPGRHDAQSQIYFVHLSPSWWAMQPLKRLSVSQCSLVSGFSIQDFEFAIRIHDFEFRIRNWGLGIWSLRFVFIDLYLFGSLGVLGFVIRDQLFSISGDFRFWIWKPNMGFGLRAWIRNLKYGWETYWTSGLDFQLERLEFGFGVQNLLWLGILFGKCFVFYLMFFDLDLNSYILLFFVYDFSCYCFIGPM